MDAITPHTHGPEGSVAVRKDGTLEYAVPCLDDNGQMHSQQLTPQQALEAWIAGTHRHQQEGRPKPSFLHTPAQLRVYLGLSQQIPKGSKEVSDSAPEPAPGPESKPQLPLKPARQPRPVRKTAARKKAASTSRRPEYVVVFKSLPPEMRTLFLGAMKTWLRIKQELADG